MGFAVRSGTPLAWRVSCWVHVRVKAAPLSLVHPVKRQTKRAEFAGGDAERRKTAPKALLRAGCPPPGADQLPALGGVAALARSQLGAGAHPN